MGILWDAGSTHRALHISLGRISRRPERFWNALQEYLVDSWKASPRE